MLIRDLLTFQIWRCFDSVLIIRGNNVVINTRDLFRLPIVLIPHHTDHNQEYQQEKHTHHTRLCPRQSRHNQQPDSGGERKTHRRQHRRHCSLIGEWPTADISQPILDQPHKLTRVLCNNMWIMMIIEKRIML